VEPEEKGLLSGRGLSGELSGESRKKEGRKKEGRRRRKGKEKLAKKPFRVGCWLRLID
jgi:hypothetical protein